MKITHDFHIHTHLSLCAPDKTGTVENYIESAKAQGLKKLGFANHFWGDTPGDSEYYKNVRSNPDGYYKKQNYEYISQIRPELEKYNSDDIKLYFGCECEYNPFTRGIAVTYEQAETFDFIIVPNSHTHMTMPLSCYEPYSRHIDFMIQAFEDTISCDLSRYVTAIAHPFHAVACPYGYDVLINMIPDDTFKRLFSSAAEKGIAMEVNVFQMKSKTFDELLQMSEIRMLKIAKNCGCKFIFGSDAHIISEHEGYSNSDAVAEVLDLTEDDIAKIAR